MDLSRRGASDEALIEELDDLRRQEREALPFLLACLAEVERRRLHLELGYATLFDFCVGRLRYSEGASARRIYSARAAARFPGLYVLLRDGALSLTAVSRLEPHLTAANFDDVIARAVGKRQRDIESLIADIVKERMIVQARLDAPAPPARLPEAALFEGVVAATFPESPPLAVVQERKRDSIRIETPGIVRFSFQAGEKLRRSLESAKILLKRDCPGGRLEEILQRLADDFLARNDPARKKPAPERPAREEQTRRVPQWVKDQVWRRDQGRCSFAASDGRRCEARAGLEYDHVLAWARGGSSDDPANIRLLCRAHNLHVARRAFGSRVPDAARA